MQYCGPIFLLLELVCSIYTIYTHMLTFFREILKFWNYNILSFYVCYYCLRHLQILAKHLKWSFLLKEVNYSPSHTWLITLIRFITLKNNWMNPCVKTERICDESGNNEFKTRKGTGFKSLRLEYWEINQAAPKCQINYWTKLAKKGLK